MNLINNFPISIFSNCADYDLCQVCEERHERIHDPMHVFAKLKRPAPGVGRKNGEMKPILKKIVYKEEQSKLKKNKKERKEEKKFEGKKDKSKERKNEWKELKRKEKEGRKEMKRKWKMEIRQR